MKFITILLTVFALKSCGNTKAAANMQDNIEVKQTEILSGKYMISSFIKKTELPENMYLNFDETTNRVSGFAGCNNFSGAYSVEGNRIKFGPFVSTKMHCKRFMDVEQSLLKTLEETTSFSLENNMLTLKNDKEDLVFGSKKTTSRIAEGDDYTIEYIATSRGSYTNVTVKNNSLTFQKDRSSKIESRECSTEEVATLFKKMEDLSIDELPNLESPSKAHQYDGAAGATLKITKDGKTYQTQTFDHGKPNAKIEELVNTILSIAEKQ